MCIRDRVTAAILFITGTAQAFSWVLTSKQVPQNLARAIMSISDGKLTFFAITAVFLLIIGCFIIESASVPILAPIIAPLAASYGIDPVHFGIIFILLACIGSVSYTHLDVYKRQISSPGSRFLFK